MILQLMRKVRLMIGIGVLRLVDDARKLQQVQVDLLSDEVRDLVNRYQNYGHSSNPKSGAEVVAIAPGGNRNALIVIAIDDPRYRKKGLAEGEHALYHWEGDYIHFKNGRIIEVVAGSKVTVTAPQIEATASTKIKATSPLVEVIASTKVSLQTPLVEMTGNLTVAGGLSVTGTSTLTGNVTSPAIIQGGTVKQGTVVLGTHVHGGVQAGGSNTGAPA